MVEPDDGVAAVELVGVTDNVAALDDVGVSVTVAVVDIVPVGLKVAALDTVGVPLLVGDRTMADGLEVDVGVGTAVVLGDGLGVGGRNATPL